MSTSLRASSSRSAVPSIDPSETTTTSTSSGGSGPAAARRIRPTFSTISSPPLKTGTTTLSSGRVRADGRCGSLETSGTLTRRL